MRFDPREDVLAPENFRPRRVALATVLFNGGLLTAGYGLFRIMPRSPGWPVVVEMLACYTVCGAIVLGLWRTLLRDVLRTRILRPGSQLGYLDLAMTMTALVIAPLVLLFAVNALFRFV